VCGSAQFTHVSFDDFRIIRDNLAGWNRTRRERLIPWLMRGPTFYQLHLLLDKHASEQLALVDHLAERVQTLGGVAVGDPRHVAELTRVPRPPHGCEEVPAMLSRLLEAHEMILSDAHDAAAQVAELGDDGTNDLLVSDVIRTGELQAWFLAEHFVDTPLVRA